MIRKLPMTKRVLQARTSTNIVEHFTANRNIPTVQLNLSVFWLFVKEWLTKWQNTESFLVISQEDNGLNSLHTDKMRKKKSKVLSCKSSENSQTNAVFSFAKFLNEEKKMRKKCFL